MRTSAGFRSCPEARTELSTNTPKSRFTHLIYGHNSSIRFSNRQSSYDQGRLPLLLAAGRLPAVLGIFFSTQRGTKTTRRASRPVIAAVTPKHDTDNDNDSKQHGLDWSWHHRRCLRATMAKRCV